MALLWNRRIAVTVDTLRITGLRMAFNVRRNLKSTSNQADVRIWNLSRDSRALLEQDKVAMRVEAGYEDTIGEIFVGYTRKPMTTREGPDIITTLHAGDGEIPMRSGRINMSFNPGTKMGSLLKKLLSAMGIAGAGTKDAERKVDSVKMRGALTEIVNGIVLSGNAWGELQKKLKGSGYEASIQDGQVQLLEVGKTTEEKAVQLSTEAGLVGSPEKGKKGLVKVRSLLQPRIRPGRKIEVVSEFINGFYRAQVANHMGDTHGQDWYTDIEGIPL